VAFHLDGGAGGGPPSWQANRRHVVRAVISAESAELWLDGQLVGRSAGDFQPYDSPLEANTVPLWASGPATYVILQDDLKLSSGGRSAWLTFAAEDARSLPLLLPKPPMPRSIEWRTIVGAPTDRGEGTAARQGRALIIEASFRIVSYDLARLAPFVDRYGQFRYADWPDKVKRDSDLTTAQAREERRLREWGVSGDYDSYGGYLRGGWRARPTGSFYGRMTRTGG
jgi:hypothetical protein